MLHFATTDLFRKRTAEKRSDKHDEKTSEIHAKSYEKWRFRQSMAESILNAFCIIFAHFLSKIYSGTSPGDPGRLKGRPVGVRGSLGEAPGVLRERIFGGKVVADVGIHDAAS